MKFPYKRLHQGVERPIIPIEVKYQDNIVDYYGLIDSGADVSVFHADIAKVLGIDLESGIKGTVTGITQGESQPYYLHDIEIVVGGWTYKTKIAFMNTLAKLGHGVLGQNGFFSLFKTIKFEFNKEVDIVRK